MNAIILAAGVGKRLQEHGKKQPKCFLNIGEKKLIDRYIESLRSSGIDNIIFVLGYMAEDIQDYLNQNYEENNFKFIINKDYTKGNVLSAWAAREYYNEEFLLMDADVAFPNNLLSKLLKSKNENCLLLDADFNNDSEEMKLGADDAGRVWEIDRHLSEKYYIEGEGVGFFKSTANAGKIFKDLLSKYVEMGKDEIEYEFVLNETMKSVNIGYELVDGIGWTEIDFYEDLEKAREIFKN